MFVETNPIPIQVALGLMGKIEPEFRLPLCAPSAANLEKIRTGLAKLNLI
jgi:4-hydroxy-tetrahydrodipicolinate synthase